MFIEVKTKGLLLPNMKSNEGWQSQRQRSNTHKCNESACFGLSTDTPVFHHACFGTPYIWKCLQHAIAIESHKAYSPSPSFFNILICISIQHYIRLLWIRGYSHKRIKNHKHMYRRHPSMQEMPVFKNSKQLQNHCKKHNSTVRLFE